MANVERMFPVIVLGGIALVAVPIPSLVAGCGGSDKPAGSSTDGGHDTGTFPVEGLPPYEAGVVHDTGMFPTEGVAVSDSGFPQEGPAQIDSGFPVEGVQATDSGTVDGGVPPIDSGTLDANDDAKG